MGRLFFNQVRLGGGIPVASHAKVTGLLMVSTTRSSAGPSILGGTEKETQRDPLIPAVVQKKATFSLRC